MALRALCIFAGESIIFSHHARECSFAELEAAPARVNAPSVSPVDHERLVSVLAVPGLGSVNAPFPATYQNGDLYTLRRINKQDIFSSHYDKP